MSEERLHFFRTTVEANSVCFNYDGFFFGKCMQFDTLNWVLSLMSAVKHLLSNDWTITMGPELAVKKCIHLSVN